MAAILPVYSARDVKISFMGYTLDGLAPDTFIEFSRSSDLTDEEVGADGSVNISISPDETGTCTISLQQNSPSNAFLSAILNKQRTDGALTSGAFTVVDPSGSVIAKLSGAHIKTAPSVSLGSTATGKAYDWVFFCQQIIYTSAPEGLEDSVGIIAEAAASAENIKDFFL